MHRRPSLLALFTGFSAGLPAAAGPAAPAGRDLPDTTPEILGEWTPMADGEPQTIHSIAGWQGSLVVATGRGDIVDHILDVDIQDPAAPVVLATERWSYENPDGSSESWYMYEPMLGDGGTVRYALDGYASNSFGDVFEIDWEFTLRWMPGQGDGSSPGVGGDWAASQMPVVAGHRGDELRLRVNGSPEGTVVHVGFHDDSPSYDGYINQVDGDRLYMSAPIGPGLWVYDISDITREPVLLSKDFPPLGHDVNAIQGGLMARAENGTGLRTDLVLYDARPVGQPTELARIDLGGTVRFPPDPMHEDRLLASTAGGGLHVFDVTVPSRPILLAQYAGFIGADGVGYGDGVFSIAADPDGTGDRVFTLAMPPLVRCSQADLDEPFGVLDLADLGGFVSAFLSLDPAADLALPAGVFDLADLSAFITAFGAGCP